MHMTRFQGGRSKPYSAVLDLNELKQFLLALTHVEDMFDTAYFAVPLCFACFPSFCRRNRSFPLNPAVNHHIPQCNVLDTHLISQPLLPQKVHTIFHRQLKLGQVAVASALKLSHFQLDPAIGPLQPRLGRGGGDFMGISPPKTISASKISQLMDM